MLDRSRYLAALAEGRDRLVAAAEQAGPDAPVPTCPHWSVRELVVHVGNVHDWAERIVRSGVEQRQDFAAPPPAGSGPGGTGSIHGLTRWYAERADSLLDCLSTEDPAAERLVWTFGPDGDAAVGFWHRRQAHELTVHVVDADLACGRATPEVLHGLDESLAGDGIDELLTVMLPRMGKFVPRPALSGVLLIGAFDPADEAEVQRQWILDRDGQLLSPAAIPDVTTALIGPTPAIFGLLWKRARLDRDGSDLDLQVEGDPRVVDELLAARLTP